MQELSFSCFNASWQTFNNHFNVGGEITCEQFINACQIGTYTKRKLKDLISDPPENLSVKRLHATSAVEAYPIDDRPRGIEDIKSIKYHMKNPIQSPCFLVNYKNRSIFLDGMHRLVAASLVGKRIVVMFVINL